MPNWNDAASIKRWADAQKEEQRKKAEAEQRAEQQRRVQQQQARQQQAQQKPTWQRPTQGPQPQVARPGQVGPAPQRGYDPRFDDPAYNNGRQQQQQARRQDPAASVQLLPSGVQVAPMRSGLGMPTAIGGGMQNRSTVATPDMTATTVARPDWQAAWRKDLQGQDVQEPAGTAPLGMIQPPNMDRLRTAMNLVGPMTTAAGSALSGWLANAGSGAETSSPEAQRMQAVRDLQTQRLGEVGPTMFGPEWRQSAPAQYFNQANEEIWQPRPDTPMPTMASAGGSVRSAWENAQQLAAGMGDIGKTKEMQAIAGYTGGLLGGMGAAWDALHAAAPESTPQGRVLSALEKGAGSLGEFMNTGVNLVKTNPVGAMGNRTIGEVAGATAETVKPGSQYWMNFGSALSAFDKARPAWTGDIQRDATTQMALMNSFSGPKAVEQTYNVLTQKDQMVAAMRQQADQAIADGDMLAAADYGKRADELERKSPKQIVDDNTEIVSDLVLSLLLDPLNLIDWSFSAAKLGTTGRRMGKALQATTRTTEEVLPELAKAVRSAEGIADTLGLAGSKKVGAWDALWLNNESRAQIDAANLFSATAQVLADVRRPEDAKALLDVLTSKPDQLLTGVRGLVGMQENWNAAGAVQYGAGIFGRKVQEALPSLMEARTTLMNLPALQGKQLNKAELLGQVADALMGSAKRVYGLADWDTPLATRSTRITDAGEGLKYVQYLDEQGNVISQGRRMTTVDASKEAAKTNSWIKAGRTEDPLVSFIRTPDRLMRGFMSSLYMNLTPGHWMRNATSAVGHLITDNNFTMESAGKLAGEISAKFGGALPEQWMMEAFQGATPVVGTGIRQASSGLASPSSSVWDFLGKHNPLSKLDRKGAEVWTGGGPIGEASFRMKAYAVPFRRYFSEQWRKATESELLPRLLQSGIDPESAGNIVDLVVDRGIHGARGDVLPAVRAAVAGVQKPMTLRSLGITEGAMGPDTYSKVAMAFDDWFAGKPLEVVQDSINAAFDEERMLFARVLADTPPQPGRHTFTDLENVQDYSEIIRDVESAARKAGADPAAASAQVRAMVAQYKDLDKNAYQNLLQEAAQAPTPQARALLMDTWMQVYDLKTAARAKQGELARAAMADATLWASYPQEVGTVWDGFFRAQEQIFGQALGAMPAAKAGNYTAQSSAWDLLDRLVGMDSKKLAKQMEKIPSGLSDPEYQKIIDAGRGFQDKAAATMYTVAQRYGDDIDAFDQVVSAEIDVRRASSAAAAELAEIRKKFPVEVLNDYEQRRAYYEATGKLWQDYWYATSARYHAASTSIVLDWAKQNLANATWFDPFPGQFYTLIEPMDVPGVGKGWKVADESGALYPHPIMEVNVPESAREAWYSAMQQQDKLEAAARQTVADVHRKLDPAPQYRTNTPKPTTLPGQQPPVPGTPKPTTLPGQQPPVPGTPKPTTLPGQQPPVPGTPKPTTLPGEGTPSGSLIADVDLIPETPKPTTLPGQRPPVPQTPKPDYLPGQEWQVGLGPGGRPTTLPGAAPRPRYTGDPSLDVDFGGANLDRNADVLTQAEASARLVRPDNYVSTATTPMGAGDVAIIKATGQQVTVSKLSESGGYYFVKDASGKTRRYKTNSLAAVPKEQPPMAATIDEGMALAAGMEPKAVGPQEPPKAWVRPESQARVDDLAAQGKAALTKQYQAQLIADGYSKTQISKMSPAEMSHAIERTSMAPIPTQEPASWLVSKAGELDEVAQTTRDAMRQQWENDVRGAWPEVPSLDSLVLRFNRDGAVRLSGVENQAGVERVFQDMVGQQLGGLEFQDINDVERWIQQYVDLGGDSKRAARLRAEAKQFKGKNTGEIIAEVYPEFVAAGWTPDMVQELASYNRRSVLETLATIREKVPSFDEYGFGDITYEFAVPAMKLPDPKADPFTLVPDLKHNFFGLIDNGNPDLYTLISGVQQAAKAAGNTAAPTIGDMAGFRYDMVEDARRKVLAALANANQAPNTMTETQKLSALNAVANYMPAWDNVVAGASQAAKDISNFTMLDYAQRNNIDNMLGLLVPYHYWFTRSAKNWVERSVFKPQLLSNFFRVQGAVEEENKRADVPMRLQGTVPIPGTNLRMANPYNMIIPYGEIYALSDFADPDSAQGLVPSIMETAKALGFGIHPIYDAAWKMANGRGLEVQAGDFVPQYRYLNYVYQGITGESLPGAGDEYDPYRTARTLGLMAISGQLDPQTATWAQDKAYQLVTGAQALPEQPDDEGWQRAFTEAAKAAGMERAMPLLARAFGGVAVYPYDPAEAKAREVQATRRGLGYAAQGNQYGSQAAVDEYDKESGYDEWGVPWRSRSAVVPPAPEGPAPRPAATPGGITFNEYQPGQGQPTPRTYPYQSPYIPQRPGEAAVNEKLKAEKKLLDKPAYPGDGASSAQWDVYNAAKAEYDAQVTALEAQYPSATKTDPKSDFYGNYSPDELLAKAQGQAEYVARSEIADMKPVYPGDNASDAQWDAYHAAKDAYNTALAQRTAEILADPQTLSELVYGRPVTGADGAPEPPLGPPMSAALNAWGDGPAPLGAFPNSQRTTPLPAYPQADGTTDPLAATRTSPAVGNTPFDAPAASGAGGYGGSASAAEWQARKASVYGLFGEDVGGYYETYLSLPKGQARADYKAQHPELKAVSLYTWNPNEYGQMQELLGQEAIMQWAMMPPSDGSEQARAGRAAYYDEYPGAFAVHSWVYGRPGQDSNQELADETEAGFSYDFGADYEAARAMFGDGIWSAVADYRRSWSKQEKDSFYAQHPEVSDFWKWWYEKLPKDQTRSASTVPGRYSTYSGGGGGGRSYTPTLRFDTPNIYAAEMQRDLQVAAPGGYMDAWRPERFDSSWLDAGRRLAPEQLRAWTPPRR